jgi:hypothetical protein
MRSCLIRLLMMVVVVFAVLWFGLPFGASFLATSALNASGFTGTHTSVQVNSDPPPMLLTGKADTIRIKSDSVFIGDLHASNIDVILRNVELLSRKIGSVDGTMKGVRVTAPNGDQVILDEVEVHGAAAAANATLTVTSEALAGLAVTMLGAQGTTATVSFKDPNLATITVAGKRQSGTLVVKNGSLLLVPASKSIPTLTLMSPGSGNPFKLTSAAVKGQQITLSGTIDVQSLLI